MIDFVLSYYFGMRPVFCLSVQSAWQIIWRCTNYFDVYDYIIGRVPKGYLKCG